MLKVRVHHADPWSPGRAETLHHRRSQAADVTTVHLLQQDDLALTVRGQVLDQLGRTVVAVVHEDDLQGDGWKGGLQPLDHVRHVLAFVLGRHHNRQERLRLSTGSSSSEVSAMEPFKGVVAIHPACSVPATPASSELVIFLP